MFYTAWAQIFNQLHHGAARLLAVKFLAGRLRGAEDPNARELAHVRAGPQQVGGPPREAGAANTSGHRWHSKGCIDV